MVLTLPTLVPKNLVDTAWLDAGMFIREAMARNGRFPVEEIYKACKDGRMQLWTVYDGDDIKAVCVTEILKYPAMQALSIIVLTGEDRESWLHHAEFLKQKAREWGCQRLEAWARPGWSRVLKDWRHTHSLLEVDV